MTSKAFELLERPKRERLSDQIASQIKGLIFSNNIHVGEKLPPERDLASQLGVSRVVMREALRSLEQAGFIEIRPGYTGGSYVSNKIYKPLFDSIYDLLQDGDLTLNHFYKARKAIESFCIEEVMGKIGKKDIEGLIEANRKLLEVTPETGKYHVYNMGFHLKIAEITGNPLIKLLVGALHSILKVIYPIPRQDKNFIRGMYERHLKLIDALKKKDIKLCKKLIIEDVSYTEKLQNLTSVKK